MGRLAATSSVELVASAGDPLLLVRCDHDRILQALSNLVSNAIKFTPAGGRIDLSVETTEGFVRFAVSDTGSGIAAELVPRLFERYRQAAETSSMGRGLGLFITKGIVEAHGGGIDVESAPGRGTTVFFGLPRATVPLAS
jgi:signal transduction histidine kinase